ncbi:HAMP domain-containing histidine kinase [Novosphingobium sp. 1949]|uniref:histidine kinase n=1 Tax=Novosphingobium organovorum TaxID=2930092 RepID=A0ABT0BCH2_9SPHN|nr:HAMP domain-containing sensor histidine kinase [Novosphingobium organovorum]MCJ2182756.1 HAMP domain-containing histidine kinase [Novosphingobium organovorum]
MRSLRARLTAAVMMPLLALAITFGTITCWMIHRTISNTADLILVGSATTISRAFAADDTVRASLVPLAINLLRSRSTPHPIYSVFDGKTLLSGRAALAPPADYLADPSSRRPRHEPASFPRSYRDPVLVNGYVNPADSIGVIQPVYLREATLDGRPVRIATEIRLLRRLDRPVVVQAADFLDDRWAYEQTYFLRVAGAGVLIGMIGVLLFYGAITWGLGPFASLTAQIHDARRHPRPNVRVALAPADPLEARLLANAFNDLMARTERATESLRQFTSNASHQLRTPLAIVRVHADVLSRYDPSSPQGATALADIVTAVDSLERLLAQLIALARMDEQAGPDQTLRTFDLVETAADTVATRVTHPDAARMDIGFEPQSSAICASGDALLANEVIANLLDNAIRYNRPDGTVTVRVLMREDHPVVEVEDDGPGIALADRERVWERFYRAPGPDAPSGSGLGLPIVRALCERMGAAIRLEEGEAGRGVRAVIDFLPANTLRRPPVTSPYLHDFDDMTAC